MSLNNILINYKTNPEAQRVMDIESLPIYRENFQNKCKLTDKDIIIYKKIFDTLHDLNYDNWDEELLQEVLKKFRKTDKIVVNKRKLYHYYNMITKDNKDLCIPKLENLLTSKKVRSYSGVLVITVFTSPYPEDDNGIPQKFSCKWDCHYCPKEPDQPRSYLLKEPGVLRANQEKFDAFGQITNRLSSLETIGHPLDKLEILILGGTFTSYPKSYIENFIRDLFYAANTYFDQLPRREKKSLLEEQYINEYTKIKIIGITVETRPDTVDYDFIKFIRTLGVTRVQLGVQHTDDYILKKINRKAYLLDTKNAIRILKDFGYKIDIHLMPNLPYSTPELDNKMFNEVLYDPDLQVDQWKIYPCEVVPWTKIKEWYESGIYKPYSEDELREVIINAKVQIHPWIRLNRIIRDIPSEYVLGGFDNPSMRDHIKHNMKLRGLECNCIRCREVKEGKIEDIKLTINTYKSSKGTEYFISYTNDSEKILYGFLRLRISQDSNIHTFFKELPEKVAWIRELHVYGKIQTTYDNKQNNKNDGVQHRGLGTKLLEECYKICKKNSVDNVIVIAGVGTRGYYKKRGFNLLGEDGGYYMIKKLESINYNIIYFLLFSLILLFNMFWIIN
jgi:ELP3 family radical SAM enzyme/protein acetyltransferase